jgi:hypothetical protein
MGRLAYDSKCPDIDKRILNHNADWKEFYGDVEEELPPNMPKPRGHPVAMSAFVDANHAGNLISYETLAQRYVHICTEWTDSMVFKETEYSQGCYIWK